MLSRNTITVIFLATCRSIIFFRNSFVLHFFFFLFFLLIWSLLIGKSCYQQDDRKRYIYTYIYIFIRNTSYFRLKKGIKRLYKKGYEYRIFFPSFSNDEIGDTAPLPKIERNKFELRREPPRYRRQPVAPYLRRNTTLSARFF